MFPGLTFLRAVPIFFLCISVNAQEKSVRLTIDAIDLESGAAVPCRIHLLDADQKALTAPGLPFFRDHFVCDGHVTLDIPPGHYTYAVERGPEWTRAEGKLNPDGPSQVEVRAGLKRISDLRGDKWFSGDMHVHRDPSHIEALMLAEDLDYAPVITWWKGNRHHTWVYEGKPLPDHVTRTFDNNRIYNLMAGEDEREGGALLFFGLDRPLSNVFQSSREFPSPMSFVLAARADHDSVHIDIEKPFWWDVPTWLASGEVDTIGLANNHMCRSTMYENEAWGKPRDDIRLPPPRGNGFWSQEIYYRILNSGIRMPPSAGSASGVLPNPVGYNRVYVYLDEPFTELAWLRGLRDGRSVVTNGPLLRVTAGPNGVLPGSIIDMTGDEQHEIQLEISIASNDTIESVEIIHNGNVIQTVDWPDSTSHHTTTTFRADGPGWFLVRAITDVKHTFRFASTAPFYLKSQTAPDFSSRSACRFFLDWVEERIERVTANVNDDTERTDVLLHHLQARRFWRARAENATAD